MIGWPAVKRILRRAYNPVQDLPTATAPDSRSNAAKSGAPSAVGDDEFIIQKCKSAFSTKLQSWVGILGPRCVDGLVLPISVMKFDGCDAPPRAVKYVTGIVQVELCDQCSRLYGDRAQSAKCFAPHRPEAGFQVLVGNEA